MAKYTKPEDIFIQQTIKFTDGNYGVPPAGEAGGEYDLEGTGSYELQVFRPRQGFDLLYKNPNMNQGSTEITQDLDDRFKLGTYTLNDRGVWEDINFNESTLGPYFTQEFEGNKSYKLKTRKTITVDTPDGPITLLPADGHANADATETGPFGEHNTGIYSVDALPFVIDPNNDEIIRVDRYYDKSIDEPIASDTQITQREAYQLATEGKISFKIVLSHPGRVPTRNDGTYVGDWLDANDNSWAIDRIGFNADGTNKRLYEGPENGYTTPVYPPYLPSVNFGQNIDIFSNRPPRNNGEYADRLIISEDNAGTENGGAYVFKLNWGDDSDIEFTDEPKLLENTTLFEHYYDRPGFYSITGVVYRIYRGHMMHYERFQTNILLNPSPLYETKLFDFSNFASIGGISKNSAFVKSLYNLVGINPLPPHEPDRAYVENLSKFNLLDVISILDTLGKVDYSKLQAYNSLLSPYQTPTDDVDSFVFGCTDPDASNYYFDINESLPEGVTELIDDGSCVFEHDVTLSIIDDGLPIPVVIQINGVEVSTDEPITLPRGTNTFTLMNDQGETEPTEGEGIDGGLGYYDYIFDGWFDENDNLAGIETGTGQRDIDILDDRTITAKFRYEDTTPPLPVQNLNVYNRENPAAIGIGVTFPPDGPQSDDMIVISFLPPEDYTSMNYDDLDRFDIYRSYYDYLQDETITELAISRDASQLSIDQGEIFSEDDNDGNKLPYREYTYRVQSVDVNGLTSTHVISDPIYPTPSDDFPDALDVTELSLTQNASRKYLFSWQQIDGSWPGLEGNFKHFKIEIDRPGSVDFLGDNAILHVGDYNFNEVDSETNLIPSSFEFSQLDEGIVFKSTTVPMGGATDLGIGDDFSIDSLPILPWKFKISVVAGDLESNSPQQSGAVPADYLSITPVNYVSYDVEVSSQTINLFQDNPNFDSSGVNTVISVDLNVPFSFDSNPTFDTLSNGTNSEFYVNPYARIFTKDTELLPPAVYGYDMNFRSDIIEIPFSDSSVNDFGITYEEDDFSELSSLIGRKFYVGIFDGNDTNLVGESPPMEIGDIFGCSEQNADNYMPLANAGNNDNYCTYSYEVEFNNYGDGGGGAIRVMVFEYQEDEDTGEIDYTRLQYKEDLNTPGNTLRYDDILNIVEANEEQETEQLVIEIDDGAELGIEGLGNGTFESWFIQDESNNITFTDQFSFPGYGQDFLINPDSFTNNVEDLNFLLYGGSPKAYLAIKFNRASANNYHDKTIGVVWTQDGGLMYDETVAEGLLGQDLNLQMFAQFDTDGHEYGSDEYPALPLNVEIFAEDDTSAASGYENQSEIGLVGPVNFILMDNEAVYNEPNHGLQGSTIDLRSRIFQAKPIEPFVDGEDIPRYSVFHHWTIVEGGEFIDKIEIQLPPSLGGQMVEVPSNNNDILLYDDWWTPDGTDQYGQDIPNNRIQLADDQLNYNDMFEGMMIFRQYHPETGAPLSPILSPKITYIPDVYDAEDKVLIRAYFIQFPDDNCFLKDTMITMENGERLPIQEIQVGMKVMSYDEQTNSITYNKVTELFHHSIEETDKYLVINDIMRVTGEHLIYVNETWSRADKIKVGDYLYDNQLNKVQVTSVEKINESVPTYNFEVENTHTYVAENIIVHNAKGGPG